MYRTAMRSASRPALRSVAPRQFVPRRFASSASPADKPRSWKSSAVRWGLAGAAFYYYCTNPMFADATRPQAIVAPPTTDSDLPTVDSVLEEKRKQIREKSSHSEASTAPSTPKQGESKTSSEAQPQATQADGSEAPSGPAALEEEAGQQGAFNPETGEINWDCPCLGGMAHGPCGEEFKTAFSCFVYSEADPKGMDCIEKFQGMQECFRQYPEIYGAELGDEEDEGQDAPEAIPEAAPEAAIKTAPEATPEAPVLVSKEPIDDDFQKLREEGPKSAGRESNAMSADPVGAEPANEAVPANWEDATAANEQFKNEEKASQSKA